MSNLRLLYNIPKGLFRLCFILLNNVYCIPTYVIWMLMLMPVKSFSRELFFKIEGFLFQWILAMVAMWCWWAGYEVEEVGDDITECLEERTLVLANHQSTGDVPMLMSTFNNKKVVLPNIMWIMDSLFKYTNFGVISVLHEDFFIMSGKSSRDKSLLALSSHVLHSFIPNNRKWMMLFPEGGFLTKRKAVSKRFAEKNNLPNLEYVTIPRVGALHVIMDTMGNTTSANNNSKILNEVPRPKMQYILDITVAYPHGQPIDLATIVFGHRPSCKTIMFYRLYNCKDLPQDPEGLTQWIFKRWEEKEKMLETYYTTGEFPASEYCTSKNMRPPRIAEQDPLRFLVIHMFFLLSSYFHLQVFNMAYQYCSSLIF